MAKKTIFSDEYGRIEEITRYRNRKTGRYQKRKSKNAIVEKEVYRIRDDGSRTGPIAIETAKTIMKTTVPRADDLDNGVIRDMLARTNVFGQIHKAGTAEIYVSGFDHDFRQQKMQGSIVFGERQQHKQLTVAVQRIMAQAGYKTQYELSEARFRYTSRRESARLESLTLVEIKVILKT